MSVNLIQSVEGLNRTKRLTLLWIRKNSFCLNAFKLEHRIFLPFSLELKHWHFLDFKPASPQKWNYHQVFCFVCMCVCLCVHPRVSISLENPDQKGETSQNYSEKYRKTNYEKKGKNIRRWVNGIWYATRQNTWVIQKGKKSK